MKRLENDIQVSIIFLSTDEYEARVTYGAHHGGGTGCTEGAALANALLGLGYHLRALHEESELAAQRARYDNMAAKRTGEP